MYRHIVSLTPENVMNPDGGDWHLHAQGSMKVMKIILELYEELLRQEMNPAGTPSVACAFYVGLTLG